MLWLLTAIIEFPAILIASASTILALCGCAACAEFRLRDWFCIKRCLRWTGKDAFDDFELMVFVHEINCDEHKLARRVRVTAGDHTVRTDRQTKGVFQQPLSVFVEQGTLLIFVDLLDNGGGVLATLKLVAADVLKQTTQQEQLFDMRQRHKLVQCPKIKLTLRVNHNADEEQGLAQHGSIDFLVSQRLRKAEEEGTQSGRKISELELLGIACAGPLELFGKNGQRQPVYVAAIGPPISRRLMLGIWNQKSDLEHRLPPTEEVDLLKVEGIQADPQRTDVFVISHFDKNRVPKKMFLRRVDRARDVWVDMLLMLVRKSREAKDAKKEKSGKSQPISPSGSTRSVLTDSTSSRRGSSSSGSHLDSRSSTASECTHVEKFPL